ncbi:MAG: RNA-directed DNA polymerase [Fibrobacterales bacterium]
MAKKVHINRGDAERVVLSESFPFEVPVNFSNEGFYFQIKHKYSFLYKILAGINSKNNFKRYSKPFGYSIKNGPDSLRHLSLIHPKNQIQCIEFYSKFENLICHFASVSEASIRAPEKIGSMSFVNNPYSESGKYKSDLVDTKIEDALSRHPSSYFAYRGYNRLYKFFNSEEFLLLEKRYSKYYKIDITKFFHSIYTHSIAWAVRSKEFIKHNLNSSSSFVNSFDELMQDINYKETNGIVIGPEISRIFSEIILQSIDTDIMSRLVEKGLEYNENYSFKRYVDDFFIFANTDAEIKLIKDTIRSCLLRYNYHINESKSVLYERPFFSLQSNLIHFLKNDISEFYNKVSELDEEKQLRLKRIFHYNKLKHSLINTIKSRCYNIENGIQIAGGYLISAFTNRLDRILSHEPYFVGEKGVLVYRDNIRILLDVMFYIYSINPTVNSSYKLCQAMLVVPKYFAKYFPEEIDTIKQCILDHAILVLKQQVFASNNHTEEAIPLEKINIILGLSTLGEKYLLSSNFIHALFFIDRPSISYFEAMSILFYIKNDKQYIGLKKVLIKKVTSDLEHSNNMMQHAESCYFILDTLTCPYLDDSLKTKLLKKIHLEYIGKYTNDKIEKELQYLKKNKWFIDWDEVNLLNCIEKKVILQAY